MGGAYLTLLNTIANLGFTLPKVFIFAGKPSSHHQFLPQAAAWLPPWLGTCLLVMTPPRAALLQSF